MSSVVEFRDSKIKAKLPTLGNIALKCALIPCFHRYMSTSAEAIGINAQFLYAPDCMLISFLVSIHTPVSKWLGHKITVSQSRPAWCVTVFLLTYYPLVTGQGHSDDQNDDGDRPPRDGSRANELRARYLRGRSTWRHPLRGGDGPPARAYEPEKPV